MSKQINYTNGITLSVSKTYLYSLYLLVPVILVFSLPYFFLWGNELFNYWENKISFLKDNFLLQSFIYNISGYLFRILLIIILGIVVHEVLHGLIWIFFTKKGFRSLSFGISKPDLAPYIHCKEALPINVYRVGIVLPGIVQGILPSILGIITGNFKIFIFGLFFTWAASGDFITLWLTRKLKSEIMVQDHPKLVGCMILEKNKLNNINK